VGKKQSDNKVKETLLRRILGDGRFLPIIVLSALSLLTFLAYIRALHAPLFFDDLEYIRPSKLMGIWNHFSLRVRSVAMLSFALDYQLWGMNLVAFRITNIVFHVLSALSAWYLAYMTLTLPSVRETYRMGEEGKTPLYISLCVATLFMLHPLQSSAVNYLTQRMAIMAGLFSFAGFIFYIKGVGGRGRMSVLYYVLSSLSFVLAIFSKENAVMALLLLPVYDLFFLSAFQWKEFRKRFITLSALLLSLVLLAAYRMSIAGFVETVFAVISSPNQPMERYAHAGMDINWTPVEYLLTELRIVSKYILLLLVPAPPLMTVDYSNAYPVSKDLFTPLTTLLSLCFLAALVFVSVRYRKRVPLVSFGIVWYLAAISLESFIALGLDPYFEHRNYLPSFGLFLAFSSSLVYVDRTKIKLPAEAIILVGAVFLFALTFVRNGVWSEGRLLWEEAVQKSPNNVRARINLGTAYADKGLTDKAIEQYRIVLTQKPDSEGAHLNLGVLFLREGWIEKAIEEFQTVLGLQSRTSSRKKDAYDVHFNLGLAFYLKGMRERAIEEYQAALRLRPDFAEAHVNLGIVYGALGSTDKAMEHFQTAVELDSHLASARYNLGTALSGRGMTAAAIEQYRIAIKSNPAYAQAHLGLGISYMTSGSIDKAMEHLQTAVRLKPGFADAHAYLGDAYYLRERTTDAIEQFQLALALNPKSAATHKKLGNAFFRKDQTDKAIEEYELALKLEPGDAITRNSLGGAYVKKGLMDKAVEQYQLAVQLNPQSAVIRQGLGDVYYNKGLLNSAAEQYQAVLKLEPDNAVCHFNLGVIYTKQRLLEKAESELEAAVKISPNEERFRKGLKAFKDYKAAVRKAEEGKNSESAPRRRLPENSSK
jgi:tetratricopeptide (TPR) repeat protein